MEQRSPMDKNESLRRLLEAYETPAELLSHADEILKAVEQATQSSGGLATYRESLGRMGEPDPLVQPIPETQISITAS